METFSGKHKLPRFERHLCDEAFLWFHMIDWYHDFVWLLYRILNSPSEVP